MLFMVGLTLAAAEGFFHASWMGLAAFVCLGAALVGATVFMIHALLRRRWIAAVVWLAALMVLAPSALVGGMVAGLAGKMLRMADHGTRTLPVDRSAMGKLATSGKELASQLGDKFELEAIIMAFGPHGREVEFKIVIRDPESFRAGISFRQHSGGAWQPAGNSFSGDPGTFEASRRRFEEVFAKTTAPTITWPLTDHVEKEWLSAAGGLADALSSTGMLNTAGIAWQPGDIRMSHRLRTGNNDGISIRLDARRGREMAANAVTYWAFNGQRALLTEVTGIVQKGTASLSTMDHGAEVRSILEPWLASQDGLLAPSVLFASRNDATWTACETLLPDGTTLIYHEQQAHPFLAEYHMRLEIRPPGGEARDFFLPMNTGGRTAILVDTGSTADGTPAIHVKTGHHFDLGFTLRDPRMIPAAAVNDAAPVGAFTGVKTRLRWASATDSTDREIYEATRGYFPRDGK